MTPLWLCQIFCTPTIPSSTWHLARSLWNGLGNPPFMLNSVHRSHMAHNLAASQQVSLHACFVAKLYGIWQKRLEMSVVVWLSSWWRLNDITSWPSMVLKVEVCLNGYSFFFVAQWHTTSVIGFSNVILFLACSGAVTNEGQQDRHNGSHREKVQHACTDHLIGRQHACATQYWHTLMDLSTRNHDRHMTESRKSIHCWY